MKKTDIQRTAHHVAEAFATVQNTLNPGLARQRLLHLAERLEEEAYEIQIFHDSIDHGNDKDLIALMQWLDLHAHALQVVAYERWPEA